MERPQYIRSQMGALGGINLLGDSDDDYASFHSNNSFESANTAVRRYTPPISPRTIALSEGSILNIVPQESEPVPKGFRHLITNAPFSGPEEEFSLTIPPPVRRSSYAFDTRAMRGKPSAMSLEYYYGSPPTPQDDRPFVLYALDQITREGGLSRNSSKTLRVASYESTSSSVPSVVLRNPPVEVPEIYRPTMKFDPKESLASLALPAPAAEEALYIPVDYTDNTIRLHRRRRRKRSPPLDFVPRVLRPWPRRLLALAILLMLVGILFCAEYSRRNNGLCQHLNPFDDRYVLFHYLFPILAAGLYLWIQGLMATLFRIAPFATMTNTGPKKRTEGIFMPLYPSAMLLPRPSYFRASQHLLGIISFLSFSLLFTLPLASSMFTVKLYDGTWRYITNLPIAYLLAAIYILALFALLGVATYLYRREHGTGLRCDPRSLGAIIALLTRSNRLDDYRSTELLGKKDMRIVLGDRAERLGYWTTTKGMQDEFYGIGVEGGPARRVSVRDGYEFPSMRVRDSLDAEKGHGIERDDNRYAYVPWFLTRPAVIAWPLLFGALYVALLIVSFHPSTSITGGFPPGLNAKPNAAGFSRSNFVFSFIPAVLGMLLFIGIQKLYFSLCRLYPWAELAKEGGQVASKSLLLDDAASATTPFGALSLAVRKGHWAMAALSITSPLAIAIPILAGGCLAMYTAVPSGAVLVFPHTPAFYSLFVILGLYFLTLIVMAVSVVRMGKRLRLPKAITCLADITSLVYGSGVLGDAVFQGVVSAVDLRTRLMTARERSGGEVRYFFGPYISKDGERCLGIERVGRVMEGERLGLKKAEERRSRGKREKRDGSWMSP